MQDLESYLSGEFREDHRHLDEIEENLDQIAKTFAHAPFCDQTGWAYEVSISRSNAPAKISHSTTAMILTALRALDWSAVEKRPSSAYPIWDDFSPPNVKKPEELTKRIDRAGSAIAPFSDGKGRFEADSLEHAEETEAEIKALLQDAYRDLQEMQRRTELWTGVREFALDQEAIEILPSLSD